MKNARKTGWLAGVLAGTMLWAVGCSQQAGDAGAAMEDSKTVKLAYVNWAEGVAVAHLLDAVLGDMGYDVELTMADVAPIYASVADGDQDVMVETWLPAMHADYYEQYGDQIELVGTWFEQGLVGLIVPSYVTIDSIEEMNAVKDQFKGQITGIDSGAGIMSTTETAIEEYGLDMELVASSGPAMTAALQGAIEKGEWIVVTGWAPHWKFARYDLKFLEDPKSVYGEAELVQMAARKGFSADYPELAAMFGKMQFSAAEIGSLMDAMNGIEEGEEEAAVRGWIAENQELVSSWTS